MKNCHNTAEKSERTFWRDPESLSRSSPFPTFIRFNLNGQPINLQPGKKVHLNLLSISL